MDNKTFIKEQNYYIPENTITDNMIKEDAYGDTYYFDINTDTSKTSSSDVADSPLDASAGASLQDKRIINMKTVNLSGKFSSRGTNNSSFKILENRIGIIIRYFESAKARQRLYTVCRKGSTFYNMMLNKVNFRFGDYVSTVEVSLSFIEVNIIELGVRETTKVYTFPDEYLPYLAGGGIYPVISTEGVEYLKKNIYLYYPKIYYSVPSNTAVNKSVFLGFENVNDALVNVSVSCSFSYDYRKNGTGDWIHYESPSAPPGSGTTSFKSGEVKALNYNFQLLNSDLTWVQSFDVKNFKVTAYLIPTTDGLNSNIVYRGSITKSDVESVLITESYTESDGSTVHLLFEYFPSRETYIVIDEDLHFGE